MYWIYIAILLCSLYVLYLYLLNHIETFITRSSRNRGRRHFREFWANIFQKINIRNIYGRLRKTIS